MEQDLKDILLKDLCARLPYDVKCKIEMWIGYDVCTIYNINSIGYVEIVEDSDTNGISIERVKPYLFPLSSMSEEQKEKYYSLQQKVIYNSKGLINSDVMEYVNWCYKNHIDIDNLIPMGLAVDCTNLNIY